MDMHAPDLLSALEAADVDELDAAGFGIIRMDRDGRVTHYNAWESRHSGLPPADVRGRRFFAEVAVCADNELVAARYGHGQPLDATLPFVFAFKLERFPVTLRLLESEDRRYLLVEKR